MAGAMALKTSTARMVTINSRAAAIASGEGVCERADSAANKQTIRQTVSIHECFRMKALLSADVGSYIIAAAALPPTYDPCNISIHREAGVLDQLAVAPLVAADARPEIRRRGDVGVAGSGGGELLHEIRLRQDRIYFVAQPLHDRRRRADRRKQA